MPSLDRGAVLRTWSLLVGLLGLCALFASSAVAEESNRYIVVLEDSVKHPGNVAERHADNRDARLKHVYRDALKGYAAVLSKSEVEAVRSDPQVAYVTLDHRLRLFAQEVPTGINRIFAPSNESIEIDGEDGERADVDVAVIDTGVSATHEDLHVFERTDCATPEKETFKCVDGTGVDYAGHGTHVAGTIGAIDNGKGVVGLAPGARIWSVRVYLFNPIELFESSAVAGVDWVADHSDEIEVANMSFGCAEPDCFSLPVQPM